jgi:hypothetical protein
METRWQVLTTGDGSLTFFSEEFGQAFHNVSGAAQEALEKFVRPCRLDRLPLERDPAQPIRLLDICFGLGYNSGLALETIWQIRPDCLVEVIGLERSPEVPRQAWQAGVGSTGALGRSGNTGLNRDPGNRSAGAERCCGAMPGKRCCRCRWGGQMRCFWIPSRLLFAQSCGRWISCGPWLNGCAPAAFWPPIPVQRRCEQLCWRRGCLSALRPRWAAPGRARWPHLSQTTYRLSRLWSGST